MVLEVALMVMAAAPRVGIVQLSVVDLPATRSELYAEHLATRLIDHGFQVTTPHDVAVLLGHERQKQLLSCDDSSCAVELANALGVEHLISGQITRLGNSYHLVLKALAANGSGVELARSVNVASEDALFTQLDDVASALEERLHPNIGVSLQRGAGHRTYTALVPAAIGLVGVGTGVGFLISAKGAFDSLALRGTDALTYQQALDAKSRGGLHQTVGIVAAAVGGAALIGGLLWFALSGRDAPAVVVVPTSNGAALVGIFP